MLTWFERLRLRTQLILGFGALVGLMLLGGSLALLGHGRTLATAEDFLDGEHRMAALSLESSAAMGKARRYEKEFLLKRQVFSYEEAKARYATLVSSQLVLVREHMASIRSLTRNSDVQTETRAIEDITYKYEAGFLHVVELYGRLGRTNDGLEGQFRARAHELEALLLQGDPERLRTDLLSLRRYEKDFIMRGWDRSADAFDASAEQFKADLTQASLPKARKTELLGLLAQYHSLFQAYVAASDDIDAATLDYLEAVHQVEPLLEQLHAQAETAVAATRGTMREQGRATTLMVVGVGLLIVLLGLLVAAFIVRNTNRSVAACVNFARRLANGDRAVRLPVSGGHNEFAILSTALNSMADAMQEAFQRDAVRAAELTRLNRTLHMLSRCNEALIKAESEADLVEVICRQIIDNGDYRLAWVGFPRDDAGKSVQAAAFAGVDEAEAYVAGLGLTWSKGSPRNGMGGLAIAEGRLVVVHDVACEPIFEPWREATLKCGFVAGIALPLKDKTTVLGALSIYSSNTLSFDAEEVKLLQELAEDLAFGIVSLREAERRKAAERALDYQANFDTVTGLPNLNLFSDRLQQAVAQASRTASQMAVLVLSLDRFKTIKDGLGYQAGNAILQHVGQSLAANLRDGDTVAYLSNNEFALAINNLATAAEVAPVALKLLAAVLEPMTLDGCNLYTSASVGISLYPKDGAEAHTLLQNANAAMSSARAMGGNLFRFYAAEMNERISAHFAMESELRRALAQDELCVYFQPRVNLASGAISGAEALVRWQHPERGLVFPSDFIPLAEETGLIHSLGEWVIKNVCRQQRIWLDAGLPVPPVAVNLSALQFRQANLASVILQALAASQLDARYIEMEITESALMDNVDEVVATLKQLRAAGIKLSLDDFGTGHSSLSRLRRLPINHLKIDQSFVRNLTLNPEDAAVCLSIINLAHNLHLTVIAEGVESEGQAAYLRQHDCDEMQGYYFSRPLPGRDFEQLLRQHKAD